MTKPDLTLIGVLIDRSGSMQGLKSDMEPALAGFLSSQAELPGAAQVSLAQFDDAYEQVWALRDITEVPSYALVPRNTTALLDATGQVHHGRRRRTGPPPGPRPSRQGHHRHHHRWPGERQPRMVA